MEPLLLLVHRIPFPPNKGDKIRSYHLLRHLARRYEIHLGTFIDDPNDWQYAEAVKQLCGSTYIASLNPKTARLRSLTAFAGGRPLSLDYYRHAGMQRWVDAAIKRHAIKRIVVFSSAMAQFVMRGEGLTRVIDFVDVDSDKWMQYASEKSWPMNWLYRREGRELLRYERMLAMRSEASLFVSQAEARLFQTLAPACADRIGYFNNGVDRDYFSPDRDYPNPYAAEEAAITFTGAMDYWPNVDAVQWFAKDIFPAIREKHPEAVFYIVGARPSPQVQALSRLPGVKVTGSVPDVRPYVAHARVAVAPLRIARGIQNKVLEAMAMARPVVVSPQALEGIDAEPGRDLLLANRESDYVDAVSFLLMNDTSTMARAARARVESRYDWTVNLSRIDAFLDGAAPAVPTVAGHALQPLSRTGTEP